MNKSEDPILFERREELKCQITAGEYKSLLDVISDQAGRAIQRLTKSAKPLPFWLNATVIALVILTADFLTSLLFGEFSALRYRAIWAELAVSGIIVVGLTALKTYLDRVYATLRENILDSIGSAEDVADLQRWLASMAKVKQPLMFSVAWAFLVGLPLNLAGAAVGGGFLSYGTTILYMSVNIGGAIFIWYIVLFLSLASRLSRYRFDLYVADPSASEVLIRSHVVGSCCRSVRFQPSCSVEDHHGSQMGETARDTEKGQAVGVARGYPFGRHAVTHQGPDGLP